MKSINECTFISLGAHVKRLCIQLHDFLVLGSCMSGNHNKPRGKASIVSE